MFSDAIKKELLNMAIGIIILTILMLVAFSLLGYLDIAVIYGALLGSGFAFLNFTLLGLSVQIAADSKPNKAQGALGLSYAVRFLLTGIVVYIGIKLPVFNYVAVVIPLVFPRIVILGIHLIRRGKKLERT